MPWVHRSLASVRVIHGPHQSDAQSWGKDYGETGERVGAATVKRMAGALALGRAGFGLGESTRRLINGPASTGAQGLWTGGLGRSTSEQLDSWANRSLDVDVNLALS